jgi:hypothetical protein
MNTKLINDIYKLEIHGDENPEYVRDLIIDLINKDK